MNLPVKITFGTGGKIEYFYDATGIKLKKKVIDGMSTTTTEYHNGFQCTNGVLDFFPHAEGYVKAVPTGGGAPGGPSILVYKYVFNFTDHLGNIRLKYAQDPSNGNAISILEEDHYYPYGLKHKGYSSSHLVFGKEDDPGTGIVLTPVNPFLGDSYKYKFGGKEYQDEFDINTYDFGARNYDPALGRWMNIDPLAELSRKFSPYAYALDNPIYFIDPDGMMGIPMAVTSLGEGIGGVNDIGGGGNEFSQDSGGQQPDPQYPNTSGVQQLEEVNLGVVKKKDKGVDGGIIFTGYGHENNGHREGTVQGYVDISDLPTGTGGAGKTPNGLMNFLRELLDILWFADDGKDAIEKYAPNESSMGNKNEEPVEPPVQEPAVYFSEEFSNGRKVSVNSNSNTKSGAVKNAKKRMRQNSNIDSTRISPFFDRGVQGNEIRKAKDTIIK